MNQIIRASEMIDRITLTSASSSKKMKSITSKELKEVEEEKHEEEMNVDIKTTTD
jgi:ribosomal silencing factor RsfS